MKDNQVSSSFLEDLAKPRPDPGGGAAAAYTALLGLALLEKVSRLELGRCTSGVELFDYWSDQLDAGRLMQDCFSRLCRDDVLAYQRLAGSRTAAMDATEQQAAVIEAVKCPLLMMSTVHQCLTLTSTIGERCRKHLVGDVLVAMELLGAALQGACHIASANLSLLKPMKAQQALSDELHQNLDRGLNHLAAARAGLTARLITTAPKQVYVDPCC